MTCNGLQGRLGNLTKSQNQSKSELTQVGLFCIMGLMGKWGDLLPGGHAVCGVRCAGENGRRGEGETGRKLKSAISKKSAIYFPFVRNISNFLLKSNPLLQFVKNTNPIFRSLLNIKAE